MTLQQETRSSLPDSPFFQNVPSAPQHSKSSFLQQNVGPSERSASLASGALVALLGLSRRDGVGVGLAAMGAALLYRGASGNCPLYGALGIDGNAGNIE